MSPRSRPALPYAFLQKMITLNRTYRSLLKSYGKQGWWPIINDETMVSEYRGTSPENNSQVFEIMAGAVLTQSVSWKNVDRALARLKVEGCLSPERLEGLAPEELASMIRSTGYYNQKAVKLKNLVSWFRGYDFSAEALEGGDTGELRRELLAVKGIGPETADSILLYALQRKIFVVDAYTRRIFTRLGILKGAEKYNDIQELFHRRFKGDAADYKEYHALIVRHGKDSCRSRPLCSRCPLAGGCVNSLTKENPVQRS